MKATKERKECKRPNRRRSFWTPSKKFRSTAQFKVDTKFFQRFGGALLQSVLDIGVGVATRKAGDGVIVALPGSTQNVTRVDQSQVTPTLRVKHGTSLSVYVARDLDFSDVER